MQNNLVTLETAKKLKVAGFPQEPTKVYWHWAVEEGVSGERIGEPLDTRAYSLPEWIGGKVEWFTAPTAQEIADQLPSDTRMYMQYGEWKAISPTMVDGGNPDRPDIKIEANGSGPTMAEALAALWLKLQEVK